MPERTSQKDDLTSADLTPAEAPDPYFYNCTEVWKPLSEALVWALAAGRRLVTGDQLPPRPTNADEDMRLRWMSDLHATLDRLGVLDAYRAHLVGSAYAVSCPWWCIGDHPKLIQGDIDFVQHRSGTLAGVDFSDKEDLHDAFSWELTVVEMESVNRDGTIAVVPVHLDASDDLPAGLDLEDAECVADAYQRAAAFMSRLVAMTEASTNRPAA